MYVYRRLYHANIKRRRVLDENSTIESGALSQLAVAWSLSSTPADTADLFCFSTTAQ